MSVETDPQILVVDDEDHNIKVIFQILIKRGFSSLKQSKNAEQGYQFALQRPLDLIITDWDMPKIDGLQFIKILKADERTKNIPIIMATGVNTEALHLEAALEAGAIDFIRKPINEVELAARVTAALKLILAHRREVETKQRALVSKQLQLDKTSELLNELQQSVDKGDLNATRKLIRGHQQFYTSSIESFVQQFESLDPLFYKKLERHLIEGSTLNASNKKFLAYLKMGMTTDELMRHLSITSDAIKKKKKRLAKNLGLSSGGDLVNFLSQL